jgi:acetylornithine deacetylase
MNTNASERRRYTPRQMIDALVAFDTTSRNSNLELIHFIRDYLGAYDVKAELIFNSEKTKANLFATLGPDVSGGTILSGHTDVVPIDGQDWATDPFKVTQKNERLYGRGTADMKSFSAIALALVPDFLAMDLKRPIHFALSYDEEVGCVGCIDMVDHIARAKARPGLVIVGEPTSMRVINAHKGIRALRTTVTGLEAHSSRQHEGVSAIMIAGKLIHFISTLFDEMKETGDPTGRFEPPYTSMQVGEISGGTAINIIPRSCTFGWEYRCLPTQDEDELLGRFNAFAMTLEVEMKKMSPTCSIQTAQIANAPGLAVETDSPAEHLALTLLERNETEAVAYGTEAGLFQKAGFPTVVCGPGDIAQAHIADEYVDLSQLEACEVFLRKVANSLTE